VGKNPSGLTLIKGEPNMGYRSTVAYSIRITPDSGDITQEKLRGAFAVFLEEAMANENTKPCFNDIAEDDKDGMEVDRERCTINFFADHVKWYEDYEDVTCHEALLQMARDWVDEDNPHSRYIGYIFVRVGENSDDIVEDCGGNYDWDWVSVYRTVNCDWL
jgi:hypothetical protein